MTKQRRLQVEDLLKETYDRLAERHPHQEIVLIEDINYKKLYLDDRRSDPESSQKIPIAEIFSDDFPEEMHEVYMGYKTTNLFQFGDKTWAIALGEAVDGYYAQPYSHDLLALDVLVDDKTPEQIREELVQEIRTSAYFRNSLIYGFHGGLRVGTRQYHFISTEFWQNPFEERMLELLEPVLPRYLYKLPECSYNRFVGPILGSSTEYPPPCGAIRYKPGFVNVLADTIETVLSETSQ